VPGKAKEILTAAVVGRQSSVVSQKNAPDMWVGLDVRIDMPREPTMKQNQWKGRRLLTGD
jgi:hypothetical protein